MTAPNHTHSGIGFPGLLTLLFIALKLLNQIDWSWWWVLAPAWIPLALILGAACVVFLFVCLMAVMPKKRRSGQ